MKNNISYINQVSNKLIKWPTSIDAKINLEKFKALRQVPFPETFGAIDGSHIKILAPWADRKIMPKLNRKMFFNRKQVATVLLQV